MKKAVFFDRDGVINHDHGYINRIEDYHFIDGAKEAIKLCHDKDYMVFVVTNQSGIARGLYSEENVKILHEYIQEELKKIGTHIDEFAYCPHHPEGKVKEYSIDCKCRKPKGGMLLKFIEKYDIDTSQSFIIGDKESDIEAGKNAGVAGYLYNGLNTLTFIEEIFKEREEKK